MNMMGNAMKWVRQITAAHLLCSLLIALAALAYGVEGTQNVVYALRHTTDDVGRIVMPVAAIVITGGIFALGAFAGLMFRAGKPVIGTVCFVLVTLLLAYSISNSVGYSFEQTVGKQRLSEALNKQAIDIAAQQNKAALDRQKQQQEWLQRTYSEMAKSRNKDDRKEARTLLTEGTKDLWTAPTPLVVPKVADVMSDGKAEAFGRYFKLDPESFRLLDSVYLSLLLSFIKWTFPALGFGYWPRGSRDEKVAAPVETPAPETPALPQPVRTVDVSIEEKQALEAQLVGEWLSLCMVHNRAAEDVQMAATDAYGAFVRWCQHVKHRGSVMSQTAFGLRMKEAGVQKRRENGFVYIGLALRKPELVTAPVRKLSAANAA